VLTFVGLDAIERAQEVRLPGGAPVLAIGDRLKADGFLLLDQRLDLTILDPLEFVGRDRALLAPGTRVFQRLCAQQASHVIGTEWWFATQCHMHQLRRLNRCICRALASLIPPPEGEGGSE
jgi:hypothetical protein